jgi:hypothetical protein
VSWLGIFALIALGAALGVTGIYILMMLSFMGVIR